VKALAAQFDASERVNIITYDQKININPLEKTS